MVRHEIEFAGLKTSQRHVLGFGLRGERTSLLLQACHEEVQEYLTGKPDGEPGRQLNNSHTQRPRLAFTYVRDAARKTCHGTACQGFNSSSTPSLSPQAPAVLGCKRTLLPDAVPRWPLIGRSPRTISCPVHRDKSSPARSRSTRPGEDAGESSTSPRGQGSPQPQEEGSTQLQPPAEDLRPLPTGLVGIEFVWGPWVFSSAVWFWL